MARAEQHGHEIDQEEGELTNSIEYYKDRSEREGIVHGQVEMLVNILIGEKYQNMEEAMAKYDVDTEKMDLKIQIMRTKACEVTEKRQQLDELLVKRTREIKDWLKFKADRTKAREYHDSMTRSATVVQAWWRGLLVRLQLGPYRQKKNDVKKTVKPKKKNEKA
ncbi:hypothetical protein NE865_14370 [Phthorimaea operculella]|nr:hypothetical protein NE865_14370 [Phthorimaea operculella]